MTAETDAAGMSAKVQGIGRDPENDRFMFISLTRPLTDDEMRDLHDYLRPWRPSEAARRLQGEGDAVRDMWPSDLGMWRQPGTGLIYELDPPAPRPAAEVRERDVKDLRQAVFMAIWSEYRDSNLRAHKVADTVLAILAQPDARKAELDADLADSIRIVCDCAEGHLNEYAYDEGAIIAERAAIELLRRRLPATPGA